jgi:hypothetical protein
MELTLSDAVKIAPDVLFQEVVGEIVLLDLAGECYFGLDEVGTRIWTLLREHEKIRSVYEIMLKEFNVEPARLQADLLAHIGELAEAGLVTLDPVHATTP